MNNPKKIILILGCVFLLTSVIVSFLSGYNAGKKKAGQTGTKTSASDTVYIYKTVSHQSPEPKRTTQVGVIPEAFFFDFSDTTIVKGDTIYIESAFPIMEREYGDSTFRAIVSGPAVHHRLPSLDLLEFYPTTEVITNTETELITPKTWSLGPFVEMGAVSGVAFGLTGLQLGYSSGRFTAAGGAGYDFFSKSPMMTARASFSLFQW